MLSYILLVRIFGSFRAIGPFSNVSCYDVFVKRDVGDPSIDDILPAVLDAEQERVALISSTTCVMRGVYGLNAVDLVVPWVHFGKPIGVRTKVYVSNDVVGSEWYGDGTYKLQQDVSGVPLEDGELQGQEAGECVVGEYTWLRDPMLGRWGVRKYAIRGWEDKAQYDGKDLGSWEDRERALTVQSAVQADRRQWWFWIVRAFDRGSEWSDWGSSAGLSPLQHLRCYGNQA